MLFGHTSLIRYGFDFLARCLKVDLCVLGVLPVVYSQIFWTVLLHGKLIGECTLTFLVFLSGWLVRCGIVVL